MLHKFTIFRTITYLNAKYAYKYVSKKTIIQCIVEKNVLVIGGRRDRPVRAFSFFYLSVAFITFSSTES